MKKDILEILEDHYGPVGMVLYSLMTFLGLIGAFIFLFHVSFSFLGPLYGSAMLILFLLGIPYYMYRRALNKEKNRDK